MIAEAIQKRAMPKGLQFEYPELELAVCCARTTTDAATAGRIRELAVEVRDWNLVSDIAARHRVTPLVHKHLLSVAPEVLKRPEASIITARARTAATRSLCLTGELMRLLAAFQEKGIAAIPIKGPILALLSFGNLAWREFDDLDILVRRRDIHRVMDLLVSMGYRPERVMAPEQEAAFIRSEHAFRYLRDRDQMVVEIHWRLQDRYLSFPLDTEELWNRASSVNVFGKQVLCLSLEDTVLFLCMHGAKHYWERLEWIACIPAVLRANPAIQWRLVLDRAARLGGIRILQLGLLLAHDLDPGCGTEAPLERMKIQPLARELAARVWNGMSAEEMTGSRREVHRFRFYLKARERLRDRLSVVRFASIRIPHPDCSILEQVALPGWLLFLHYFIGPVRLVRKYGLQGLRGVVRPTRIP